MPAVIPFIPAIIGGASSVISGVIGSKGASGAEEQLVQGAEKAGQQVLDAGKVAAEGIQGATKDAITGATTSTQGAIQTVNDATAVANQQLTDATKLQTQNQQPYTTAGATAVTRLGEATAPGGEYSQGFKFDGTDLENTKGYQFQLQEGLKALERSKSATGQGVGGAAIKEALRYSQGLADSTFDAAYKRQEGTFNTQRNLTLGTLRDLASLGQTGTQNVNSAIGTNTGRIADNMVGAGQFEGNAGIRLGEYTGNTLQRGSQIATGYEFDAARSNADLITQAANARAAGTIGRAKAYTGVTQGVAKAGVDAYTGWKNRKAA